MKKMMIAACAVAFAAVTQAATCYWNFQTASKESLYSSDLSTEYSGSVFAFMVTDSVTQDSVLQAALKGTDISTIAGTKFELTVDGGVIALKDHKGYQTTGSGEADQSWFLALVQDDKVYISDADPWGESTQESGSTVKFAVEDSSSTAQSGSTFAAGGWYSAVPEPTSGLLLLLGVAGLALRRRRA